MSGLKNLCEICDDKMAEWEDGDICSWCIDHGSEINSQFDSEGEVFDGM